jgi:hypothetical protein
MTGILLRLKPGPSVLACHSWRRWHWSPLPLRRDDSYTTTGNSRLGYKFRFLLESNTELGLDGVDDFLFESQQVSRGFGVFVN